MYHESDLEAAVEAGALTEISAARLRRFLAEREDAPPPRERDRHFRYAVRPRSILPAAGLVVLLVGFSLLSAGVLFRFGGLPVLALAWWLSRRFSERRDGLTLSILFLAFAVNVAMSLLHAALALVPGVPSVAGVSSAQGLVVAGGCALASFAYWQRFRLPISFAAGVLATMTVADHLMRMAFPGPPDRLAWTWPIVFAVVILVVAMWWDMNDVYRQTIRSDVAFWLHGAAGFLLASSCAHALFGVRPAETEWGELWSAVIEVTPVTALACLAIYLAFVVAALVVDRLALVVFGSLFALGSLHSLGGMALLPFTLLLTGAGCLIFALHWRPLRGRALALLPEVVRAQLPRSNPVFLGPRPVP